MSISEEPDPDKYVLATYVVPPLPRPVATYAQLAGKSLALRQASEGLAIRANFTDEKGGLLRLAYPIGLFEPDNVAQWIVLLTSILASPHITRLIDVSIPKILTDGYRGPKFGVEGLRALSGTDGTRRPHLAAPLGEIGMTAEEMSSMAYEVGSGGIDLFRDATALTDQGFCRLPSRVVKVMESLDRICEEGGQRILYAVNVTSEAPEVLDRADMAIEHGANCLMIDASAGGLSYIRQLSDDASIAVPIYVPRPSCEAEGGYIVSMSVFSKLVRLLGGDQLELEIGRGVDEEAKASKDALLLDWQGLKGVFPVAAGNVGVRTVHSIVEGLGKDLVVLADEGVWAHPQGGRAGAIAMHQALNAVMSGGSV
jgi:ribulose 1,5-bisphosphate carboxylase large subunit-like protein